jgi:hypothetical protein
VKRASFFNSLLFVPAAIKRLIFDKPGKAEPAQGIKYYEDLSVLNQFLLAVLRIEKWLLNFVSFPFGLSILLLASKE